MTKLTGTAYETALRNAGSRTRSALLALVMTSIIVGASACASSGSNVETVMVNPAAGNPSRATTPWPVKTREHVDLWLHGFGLLDSSVSPIPLFQPGYRDAMIVYKNQANVLTQFDANLDRLTEAVRESPAMMDAQFLALYFPSLDVMRSAIDKYVATSGNPNAVSSESEAIAFNILHNYFRSQRDMAWLALFSSSLWDEYDKYYRSYWMQHSRARGNIIDSVESMWEHLMRPRIQRFLNNTNQASGDIILSLPLSGEGRAMGGGPGGRGIIAVTFPKRPADAPQALYVIAHEVVASLVQAVISDHVTPAQRREGYADHLQGLGAIVGGYFLLKQLVPELADGYARYYLTLAGHQPGTDVKAQLLKTFELPAQIRTGIAERIHVVQGGI